VAELVELFGEGIHSYAQVSRLLLRIASTLTAHVLQVSHCGPTAEPLFNLTTTFM
jgi:hypothetical protein